MISDVEFLRAVIVVQDKEATDEMRKWAWGVIYDYELKRVPTRFKLTVIDGGKGKAA